MYIYMYIQGGLGRDSSRAAVRAVSSADPASCAVADTRSVMLPAPRERVPGYQRERGYQATKGMEGWSDGQRE